MDRLDVLEWRLNWAIKIGAPVAIVLLILCFDASVQVRKVPTLAHTERMVQKITAHVDSIRKVDREKIDSIMNYYLAPTDSLEGP